MFTIYVHTNNNAYYTTLGTRRRAEWEGGYRGGKKEINIYLLLHCHHQNDTCIKMGSEESHFSVSLTGRDKVTRQRP